MPSIQQNATRLQQWFDSRSVSAGSANKAQMQEASQALNVPVGELHEARRLLVEQAARRNEVPAQSGVLTGRGLQTNAAHGGVSAQQASFRLERGFGGHPQIKAFEQSTYTLLDAKQVMDKLGLRSIDEGKKHIGEKILKGAEGELRALGVSPDNYDSYELRDAFKRSSYSTADAEAALAKMPFLASVDDAKEYIGLKIVNGREAERTILEPLGITRHDFDRHDCLAAFATSTYSDADVRAAKRKFDFLAGSTNAEVKEYIGLKIVNKYESMLEEAGITPSPFDNHDLRAAFKTSSYSKADVDTAKNAFDFLAGKSDAEVERYIGLKIVNGYESMLADAGITPHDFDDHDCIAAFEKSGYDMADVKAARDAFDFLQGYSDADVKRYIGLKIVNDYESMLAEKGIVPDGGAAAEHVMSQQEMNMAAYDALGASHTKLTNAANEVLRAVDPETKKDIRAALESFNDYVGKHGEFSGNLEARGGSLAPLVNAGSQKPMVDQLRKEYARAGDQGYFNYQGSGKAPDSASQQEMNHAAYDAFSVADSKMNGLVDAIKTKLAGVDPESVKEFDSAQLAFAKFRDLQATVAGNMEARGGSLFGLIHASSMEALTHQRIALLEETLKGLT